MVGGPFMSKKSDKTETTADDVEHDPKAEREAEERMHATGHGDQEDKDPPGGHDDGALEDAAEKFAVER
jgi:hypothetical protein